MKCIFCFYSYIMGPRKKEAIHNATMVVNGVSTCDTHMNEAIAISTTSLQALLQDVLLDDFQIHRDRGSQ
jgi:hypothetical protein